MQSHFLSYGKGKLRTENITIMDFMEIRKLYHITGNVGYSKGAISKASEKFGKLPTVLTEYYRQLGKHPGLNHADYYLCAPGKLDFLIYGDYLCFYKAAGEPLCWYIDMEKLESDNPPVYRRNLNGDSVCDELDSETLEEFLYVMAYWQALFYLPYKSNGSFMCTFRQIEWIEEKFQLKPYNLSKWPQFYGNSSDEVICVSREKNSAQVLYACTSKEQLEKIKSVIYHGI